MLFWVVGNAKCVNDVQTFMNFRLETFSQKYVLPYCELISHWEGVIASRSMQNLAYGYVFYGA